MIYILLVYSLLTLLLVISWLKMKDFVPEKKYPLKTLISVIIPCRNEAKNIQNLLEDLQNQNYPFPNFEVIIADDNSEDSTYQIANNFESNFSKIVFKITNSPTDSPKKQAIKQAIQLSEGELIVCTDGDCSVGENWLLAIQQFYVQTNAKLISGGVTFFVEKSFFSTFQIIEFASLIGTGACAMFLKKPNMCNGANIAYTRQVFEEVNGFAGNEHLASGDDEFLMHKIAQKYPNDVHFLKAKSAIVRTKVQENFQSFFQQRRRWASKWKYYHQFSTTALAIYIFLVNFLLIFTFTNLVIEIYSVKYLFEIFVLKCGIESLFLAMVLQFLGHSKKIIWIPIIQIIYPFYVVFFGIIAQFNQKYSWKGRILK